MPGFSFPAPRRLEQIIKYALLEREPPEQIFEIWKNHHIERRDACGMVVDTETWKGWKAEAKKHPYFVFPVQKGDGKFFTVLSQFQDNYCIFTYLEDYRKDPNNAEPYMAVAFHEDFQDKKGLVLVRGDFSAHLTKDEARRLLWLLSHYYLKEPKLVRTFNKEPEKFDFNSYLQSCPA